MVSGAGWRTEESARPASKSYSPILRSNPATRAPNRILPRPVRRVGATLPLLAYVGVGKSVGTRPLGLYRTTQKVCGAPSAYRSPKPTSPDSPRPLPPFKMVSPQYRFAELPSQ